MKIEPGTRVGLCAHVELRRGEAAEVMVMDVTTDEGVITICVCPPCFVRYTETDDLTVVVTRQFVCREDLDVHINMEAPS